MQLRYFALLFLSFATACDKSPLSPELLNRQPLIGPHHWPTREIVPASSSQRPDTVLVTDFGALPDDGLDDTEAFRRALVSDRLVQIPQGTFDLVETLILPSRITLEGRGPATHLNMRTSGQSIFLAASNGSPFIEDLALRNFRATAPAAHAAVLSVISARHVSIENLLVEGIGIFHSSTHFSIETWDKTPDPAATAGLTQLEQLGGYFRITGNHARGGEGSPQAITLAFVNHAYVARNDIEGYAHGVQWWGGDANPSRGGMPGIPRWARTLVIEKNRIYRSGSKTMPYSGGAIWGSMGEDILVAENEVAICTDICLDAEGSNRVTFLDNQVGAATHAGLGVFHFSEDVRFVGNRVTQDGSMGRTLFKVWNDTQMEGNSRVTLSRNTLRYTGSSGVGTLYKESTKEALFQQNLFENVALDLAFNNNGRIYIEDNQIRFTRSTGALSAIHVGMTHAQEAHVRGNHISSSVGQGGEAPGVLVSQANSHKSYVEDNVVTGYPVSVALVGPGSFWVQSNRLSGRVENRSRGENMAKITDNHNIAP